MWGQTGCSLQLCPQQDCPVLSSHCSPWHCQPLPVQDFSLILSFLAVPPLWVSLEPCSRPRQCFLGCSGSPGPALLTLQLPAALFLLIQPRLCTLSLPPHFPPRIFPLASHSLQDMSHSLQWEIKVWIKIYYIIPSLKATFRLKGSKDKFLKARKRFRD